MSHGVKLVSLSVQDVGALDGRIDLGPFSRRMSVISGCNEAEKSALVEALRMALFERHDARHPRIMALQTQGTRNPPEIWVELELGGERMSVHKRFLEKSLAEVRLHGNRGVLTGARAEEELLARLGGWRPARHGGERNDLGRCGLLEDPAVQYRDLMVQLREAESKLPRLEAKHEAALAAEARAQTIERLARETESRLAIAEAMFEAVHEEVAARRGMVPDALLAERHASALAELGPAHTSARNAAAELDAMAPQLLGGEVLRAQAAVASCKRGVRELHEKAQARVMARDRRPFPLILDDTRGWTDDGHFLSMVQILRDASSELQILLLTCHPARFNRFPAEYLVDLDQLRDARSRVA